MNKNFEDLNRSVIQSNYYDYTKVGLLVARGKFDISIYDTGYTFDAQKTFLLIENISSIIGVFSKDDNLFQEGILTCLGECFSLQEIETELKSVGAFYSFKKNGNLIVACDSKKICYAFCKYNFSFLLTFPRRLINYSDKNDVDYVSRIEDENEAFAIQLLKNLTLAEKVYLNNEDKNFLQAFCADFASSDFSKNAMDDFCFANTVSVVSKEILLGLKEYIQNMVEVFSKANISDNYKERIEKVIITINKYL